MICILAQAGTMILWSFFDFLRNPYMFLGPKKWHKTIQGKLMMISWYKLFPSDFIGFLSLNLTTASNFQHLICWHPDQGSMEVWNYVCRFTEGFTRCENLMSRPIQAPNQCTVACPLRTTGVFASDL